MINWLDQGKPTVRPERNSKGLRKVELVRHTHKRQRLPSPYLHDALSLRSGNSTPNLRPCSKYVDSSDYWEPGIGQWISPQGEYWLTSPTESVCRQEEGNRQKEVHKEQIRDPHGPRNTLICVYLKWQPWWWERGSFLSPDTVTDSFKLHEGPGMQSEKLLFYQHWSRSSIFQNPHFKQPALRSHL